MAQRIQRSREQGSEISEPQAGAGKRDSFYVNRSCAGIGQVSGVSAQRALARAASRSQVPRIALLVCLGALFLAGCGPAWTPVEKRSGAAAPRELTADGR